MSIQKTDIKLMASQRLTDYYDGGGQMTGAEIIDGVVNNLFPDISRLDRVYGRVSLRKAFPAVMTDNTDMYYGAHAIITEPPEDDNVHVTLFSTDNFYDIRDDAKNRVESYVSIAHELLWRPLNNQLEGQRAITAFARPGTERPEVSQTIALKNAGNGNLQYVRITDLDAERVTFSHEKYGDFTVEVLTLGLSAPLQYDFPGIDPTPYTTKADTRIHATVVADASSYYGVSRMAQAAAAGDMNFWANSIYAQLVPTSQIETPLVDQLMGGSHVSMIAKGPEGSLTFSGIRSNGANIIHMPSGVLPGSLTLTIDGYTFTDRRGLLVPVDSDGGYSGTIEYHSGQIIIERSSAWTQLVSITATPAVAVQEAIASTEIFIELANRAFNYTPSLTGPLPSPGSIQISYMAQGKWYELYDDGQGVIVGNEQGIGTGTVDYGSGSMILTLGALPDVGSSIIIQWGHGIEISDRKGSVDADTMMIRHTLPHEGIKPGSVTITWTDDAAPKTATDDGFGVISGDATGRIAYHDGQILFAPVVVPESGTEFTIDYEQHSPMTATDNSSAGSNGMIDVTIPNAPLLPGTIGFDFTVRRISKKYATGRIAHDTIYRSVSEDGQGNIVDENGSNIGTLNYTTGAASFLACRSYIHSVYAWTSSVKVSRPIISKTTAVAREVLNSSLTLRYEKDEAITWEPLQTSIASAPLKIDLAPTTVESLIAGSVVFEMDGHDYYDDAAGNLYRDKDSATGVGTLCGEINYQTGIATLNTYPQTSSTAVTLTSLLTSDGGFTPSAYFFRTPGAPVRDGSLNLRATLPDGTLLTAQAGNNGEIIDTLINGTIDTSVGVVRIAFGEKVVAAGNEDEPWYNADAVDESGKIWKPTGVLPETALYNCVIYSFLPLDADLLGIEPIRLPLDGRVPIFKSGNIAVVHHTANEQLPNPVVANDVITLSRGALAMVDIRDQTGELVDETLYTLDLDAGTVTFTAPLDLSAYTQPLIAYHRIEDMVLIAEAQINGLIRTVGPITHDYPATETQISTAIIFGDLAARIVRSFTQKTWDNVWRDERSGDDTSAKYDDLNYPIMLTNKGSIAQRWAIKFNSSTTFDVISERLGVIASGTTGSDVAPINPATDVPYFTIDARGWGSGWSTGNVLRFDTSAANAPMWIARTTMQGPVEEPTDDFIIQIRGDAN
jgi:hypothetical protein